ncbi:MAG TPA: EF-hand domain-containing protein [Dokdonella sp.]
MTTAMLALCAASAYAQQDTHTTTYDTADGPLVVHSGQPQRTNYGAPPPFSQLDRGGRGYLTSDDAAAYPPLANDFIYADSNRDGRVSRSEYERWAKAPQ